MVGGEGCGSAGECEFGRWSLKPMSGTAKVSFTQLDLFTGARSQVQKEIPFTLKASVEADAKVVRSLLLKPLSCVRASML